MNSKILEQGSGLHEDALDQVLADNLQPASSEDSLDYSDKGANQIIDDSNEAKCHDILFYPDEVEVEKSSADSAQSVVYFGREATLQIRVVLKQYRRKSFRNMLREIKIFSLLEQYKKA